jgi:hypothetical protein
MKVTDKLKQLIFKHLYKELGNAEIIPYNHSIWFIDRENTYWYFELTKSGKLWWRYDYFTSLFEIFSMNDSQFVPLLIGWVEEVLNSKVSITCNCLYDSDTWVEEVLNSKVSTSPFQKLTSRTTVEEALNYKVYTADNHNYIYINPAEEVLNSKVSTTSKSSIAGITVVEEVLNHKVSRTIWQQHPMIAVVEDVLNHKVLNNTEQNESNR